MKCKEIIEILEQEFPMKYAESWDHTGFQIGDREREISHVYVALDTTEEILEEAIQQGADMIITHHPMLFSAMSAITSDTVKGRKVLRMAEKGICYLSVHTNYDTCRMAELAAKILEMSNAQVLEEVTEGQGIGRLGSLPREMSVRECAIYVKQAFKIPSVRFFGDGEKRVRTAAICPGAGKSLLEACHEKGAEIYITGDIDHHTGIDEAEAGLPIIDAGHYGIEHIYIEDMAKILKERCPKVKVTKAKIRHPFEVI